MLKFMMPIKIPNLLFTRENSSNFPLISATFLLLSTKQRIPSTFTRPRHNCSFSCMRHCITHISYLCRLSKPKTIPYHITFFILTENSRLSSLALLTVLMLQIFFIKIESKEQFGHNNTIAVSFSCFKVVTNWKVSFS